MIRTEYNGEAFYLMTASPNWESPVKLTLEIANQTSQGRSDRRAARPIGEAIRIPNYSFRTWLEDEELRGLVDGLKVRTTERLLVPLWMEYYPKKAYDALFDAGLYLHFVADESGEFSSTNYWEVRSDRTVVHVDPSEAVIVLPLLVAEFRDPPKVDLNDDELVDYEFRFEEDSEAQLALRLAQAYVPPFNGPSIGGRVYPLFPFVPNFDRGIESGSAEVLVENRRLGSGRRLLKDYDGALPSRPQRVVIDTFDEFETFEFLGFWHTMKGAVERFWVESHVSPGRLAATTNGPSNQLELDTVDHLEVGSFLLIEDASLDSIRYSAQITAIDGNLITLDQVVGPEEGLVPIQTAVRELMLARFENTFLKLTWDTDQTFEVALEMREVKPELLQAEAIGQTLGALAIRTSLYTVTDKAGNAWHYTSYERDLEYNGETFVSYPIQHDAISAGIELNDSTRVRVEAIADSPFTRFFNVLSGEIDRLYVQIERVELDATGLVDSVKRSFFGEFVAPEYTGNQLVISATMLSRDLDSRLPRMRFQRPCNYSLFRKGCNLVRNDWGFDGTVTDIDSNSGQITVTGITRQNGDVVPAGLDAIAQWGSLEVNGKKWTVVLASYDGSALVMTLGGISGVPEVGASVVLQAGCSGSPTECQAFGNYLNFGGNLNADGNLSLIRVSSDVSGGGKK